MAGKPKSSKKANQLIARLARSMEARDCAGSAKLLKRATAALANAAGSPKRLQYTPGYGRLLRLEAQWQISCKRGR